MPSRTSTRRSLTARTAVLVVASGLFLAPGCASYHVRTPDSDPVAERYQRATVHAYVWGLWYDPQVLMARCESQALDDVIVQRSYLHDLAGVLTLGLWMPTTLEYRCKAPRGDVGRFPEPPPRRP